MDQARLSEIFAPHQIRYNEPMSSHVTMRVGGSADMFLCPETPEQLLLALECCPDALVIGNGSNLIVRDGGIRGAVIWTGAMSGVTVEGSTLTASAGALMSAAAAMSLKHGLTGLEFAAGIPGSIGGGCCMNAGAYGEEMSGVLRRARVYMNGRDEWFDVNSLDMAYRSTRIMKEGGVVLEAEFELAPADPSVIKAKMDELAQRRRDKQPLNLPSSGSTFKRPDGYFAGALIEGAGLKGLSRGGASVSEKHAGFIVNSGGATASDVLGLIEDVKRAVFDKYGVALECEVRIVGED